MKPMDYGPFKKWITKKGYDIGHSTNHHVILDKNGKVVARFAVSHKAGGKDFVRPCYIKEIQKAIGP